jgi:pyruvate formate lyase activating enzyme
VQETLPALDLFLFDLKLLDPRQHEELTGSDNARLLGNFRRLLAAGKAVTVRFPLVPGVNDGRSHLEALADFLSKEAPGICLDILPYHRLGNTKYLGLGKRYSLEHLEPPPQQRVQGVIEYFAGRGLAARLEL